MASHDNAQSNNVNQPDQQVNLVPSSMVVNVPCFTRPFSVEYAWAAENLHLPMTIGYGDTEAEAKADFYEQALHRYMELTAAEGRVEFLTLSRARELEYLRNCQAQADVESGRDGARE